MNSATLKIVQRVLVNAFYKANAGFFSFWFFMLFGIVQPVIGYHLSLIQGMIRDYIFLGCVVILWFFYSCKCIHFIARQYKEPANGFLLVLNKLSAGKQYRLMLWVHLQVYMPVLVYAIIVAIIAARQAFYASMAIVLISNTILVLLSAALYTRFLQKKEWQLLRFLVTTRSFTVSKPLFTLPLWFLWKDRRQMLMVTKVFSFFVIYVFAALYEPEQHDVRPLQLILLLVGIFHCAMVFQVRSFEEEYLGFSRSLPVARLQRFSGLLAAYTILLLPELLLIWRAYPAAFVSSDYPQLLLFAISIPVFLHSLLLMEEMDMESYIRIVFAAGAVLFFITLYNPGIILPVAVLLLSFAFFHAHFYTFEKRHT